MDFTMIDLVETPPMTPRNHRLIVDVKAELDGPLTPRAVQTVWCEAAVYIPLVIGAGIVLGLVAWLVAVG